MTRDRRLVRRAARNLVRSYRGNVLEFILEEEYWSRDIGDAASGDAWLEIAIVAAEMIRKEQARGPA
jgi:hypothetical protein